MGVEVRAGEVDGHPHLVASGPPDGDAGPPPQVEAARPEGTWLVSVRPPDHPGRAAAAARAMAEAIADAGGGPLRWWTAPLPPGDDDVTDGGDEAVAGALGLARTRELYELARPLPAPAGVRAEVRALRAGVDEPALLAVNNRAFAWHPDQSGWDRDRLADAVADGDLVADDVLLAWDGDELAGFCWTKVHGHRTPAEGEIFVIGVDPDHQGHGLGRSLTLAGLDHLHAVHATPIGMLYVESVNAPALALYGSLGFAHRATMRCYEGDVAAR